MIEVPMALLRYRGQLRDAVALDLRRRPRRRVSGRRTVQLTVPLAGAVAAGVLAVAVTGGTHVQSANAAILRRVADALTSPPAAILHERALVTLGSRTEPYELWSLSTPPHSYHVIKWGHEGTGSSGAPDDPAATLRSLVRSGRAVVEGATTLDGVAAYKLSVTGSPERFLNGIAYVSRSTYYPLLIETTAYGGERIAFQSYEYLAATPATLQHLRASSPTSSAPGK